MKGSLLLFTSAHDNTTSWNSMQLVACCCATGTWLLLDARQPNKQLSTAHDP